MRAVLGNGREADLDVFVGAVTLGRPGAGGYRGRRRR